TRSICVAAREPVRGQHRHRLVPASQRRDEALLQRGRGDRYARRDLAPLPLPRAGAHHPVRPGDARVREVHRAHRARGDPSALKAVARMDGEHYPGVVRGALEGLPYEWVGAILVGGTEKLRGDADYGVPLLEGFGDAEAVVDLSDEPVLGPDDRFRWASQAMAAGLSYIGADFRFDPPAYADFELPSIAVIGAGKRVGKTALSAHLAALLARDRGVVV